MTAIKPAATVVVVRDGDNGLEVLMLCRNRQAGFVGGYWVFPGGTVTKHELDSSGEQSAALVAVVRECREEAGLDLDTERLSLFAYWLTPEESPKRFSTWFFIYQTKDSDEIVVDGEEIIDYRWERPAVLIREHRRGNLKLMPPTYVTLLELSEFSNTRDALGSYQERGIRHYMPRIATREGRVYTMYQEDAGYESRNPYISGSRHRSWMDESGCYYERNI
jgi:8-oxo-dGTP pyrophosphatase MutT (NUDIX family)